VCVCVCDIHIGICEKQKRTLRELSRQPILMRRTFPFPPAAISKGQITLQSNFFTFSIQELSKYHHTFAFPPAAISGCQT
jgi:hypothetical protein